MSASNAPVPVRAYVYLALGLLQYKTAVWFCSPGPQRDLYKFYVAIIVVAHVLGRRAGLAIKDQ